VLCVIYFPASILDYDHLLIEMFVEHYVAFYIAYVSAKIHLIIQLPSHLTYIDKTTIHSLLESFSLQYRSNISD
jgi:hypothetical protein